LGNVFPVNSMKSVNIFILLAVSVFASGCATGPNSHDPLEPMNRKVYAFNKTVDKIVVKPVARAYTAFVPSLVRTGVRNFYTNLGVLNTAFNDLLQGKVSNVPSDVARFTTNLILGVGGVFDVASEIGIPYHQEDFGQTLGHWGFGSGPYLVLPLLGPSSVRDGLGKPADYFMDPITHINDDTTRLALTGLELIDIRSRFLESEDMLSDAAIDEYSFVRDSWLQRREFQVRDGAPNPSYENKYRPKSFRELEMELAEE